MAMLIIFADVDQTVIISKQNRGMLSNKHCAHTCVSELWCEKTCHVFNEFGTTQVRGPQVNKQVYAKNGTKFQNSVRMTYL